MNATTDAAPEPLRGLRLAVVSVAITSANFMNILDTTIATVAVPAISGSLAATPSQGTWIITSYSACLAVVLPLAGWITRRFGEVRVFTFALLLFTLMSLACAAAPSFTVLILFRALQGISGGLLLPLSQTLLLRLYPKEMHGTAIGAWALSSSLAPIMGPILGGYLTDNFGWPWIFYVNVPLGVAACYICWWALHTRESTIVKDPVDGVGLVLLAASVICLQLTLDRGAELDWFASPQICMLSGVSALGLLFFLAWERHEPHPVIDFSLFGYRDFVIGTLLFGLIYISMVMPQVLYPIWLQTVMGYSATWAGLVMAPSMIPPMILFPLTGRYMKHGNIKLMVVTGCLIYGYALLLSAQSTTGMSAGYMSTVRTIMGFGMPFLFVTLLTFSMAPIPPEKYSSGAGIFNFTRTAMSSLGTASAVSLWDGRSIVHRSTIVAQLDPVSAQAQHALGVLARQGAPSNAAWAVIDHLVQQQAATLALNDVFYVSTCSVFAIGVLALFLVPRSIARPRPATAAATD